MHQIKASNRPTQWGKGGGVAFIIDEAVKHQQLKPINNDKQFGLIGIQTKMRKTQKLIKIYIHSHSSGKSGYSALRAKN